MRVMLDANVLLDCLVLEANGQPRPGKAASERLLDLCDTGVHHGLVAWHTLPIVAFYHARQNTQHDTGSMMENGVGERIPNTKTVPRNEFRIKDETNKRRRAQERWAAHPGEPSNQIGQSRKYLD